MHELYHHVQHLNGDSGDDICNSDLETPAYKVQIAYHSIELDDFGFATSLEKIEKQ